MAGSASWTSSRASIARTRRIRSGRCGTTSCHRARPIDLADRATARATYRKLLATGAGWLPGWYVRRPMGEWSFDVADRRMAEAQAVLALRSRVDAAASPLGLQPTRRSRRRTNGRQRARGRHGPRHRRARRAWAGSPTPRPRLEAEPDLISTIGLMGATPGVSYEAARAAFERGDIAGATSSAEAASATVAGAAALGQQRLAIGIGVVIALLALIVMLRVAPATPSPKRRGGLRRSGGRRALRYTRRRSGRGAAEHEQAPAGCRGRRCPG